MKGAPVGKRGVEQPHLDQFASRIHSAMIQHHERAVIVGHRPDQANQDRPKAQPILHAPRDLDPVKTLSFQEKTDLRQGQVGYDKTRAVGKIIKGIKKIREIHTAEPQQPTHRLGAGMRDQIGAQILEQLVGRAPDLCGQRTNQPLGYLGLAGHQWLECRLAQRERLDNPDPERLTIIVAHEPFDRPVNQPVHVPLHANAPKLARFL